MGQPVVHFEITGHDAPRLQAFYAALFDWEVDADNPVQYGMVDREKNLSPAGIGIGGGIGGVPADAEGYVTFYVEVPDVGQALAAAESLGGTRLMGPVLVMERLTIGMFADPEGHTVGLIEGGG